MAIHLGQCYRNNLRDRYLCHFWLDLQNVSVFQDGFCNYGKKSIEAKECTDESGNTPN